MSSIPNPILYDYEYGEGEDLQPPEPSFFDKLLMSVKAGWTVLTQQGVAIYTGSGVYQVGGSNNILKPLGDPKEPTIPAIRHMTPAKLAMIAGGVVVLIALYRRGKR